MNFQQPPFQVPPFHHPFVQPPPFFQPARSVHYHPGHPQYPYGPGHWGHPQSPATPHGPVRGPNGVITPGPTPPILSPQVPYTNGYSPGQTTRNLPADIPHLDVDVFWKQRLAPLPGFCSAPDLFKAKEPPRLSAPLQQHQQQQAAPSTRPQLMAPRSSISISAPSFSSNSVTCSKDEEPFEFDVHAETYIPQWLRKIQNQPHSFTALPPIPVYPPSSYYKHFLPINLIEMFEKTSIILSKPPPLEDACVLPIHENYHGHWLTLQSWELRKVAEEKTKVVLWKVQVSISSWEKGEFSIFVPGIRENYPRLEIGDIIHLREVVMEWETGTNMAFEGRVVLLRKREGYVHFYCPALREYMLVSLSPGGLQMEPVFKDGNNAPNLFNASFLTNAGPAVAMDIATLTLDEFLRNAAEKRVLAHRWLFPEIQDLQLYPPVPSCPPNMSETVWVDNGLNVEQRVAASSIASYQSPVPFLISGPPGTGKTRTIVETVHQILRIHPEAHILLCAPSNPATDTLALRLGSILQPRDMLRLNDPNRTFAEIPDTIRQFCYVEDDKFALPPWKALMRYRVVVTSCLDASMLVAGYCTNTILCALEEHTMKSLHPHRRIAHQTVPHWTHLLIDEAAQGSEPELTIPISVVYAQPSEPEPQDGVNGSNAHAPSPPLGYHPLSTTPQLVLCGDPNQLGPIISSDEARNHDLDVSLLERLFERSLYSEHPEARAKIGHGYHVKTGPFKPFVNLVKNYRSHPAILMPPSAMFYNDTLEPYAVNGLISWAGLPNPTFPLKFIGTAEREDSVNEKTTWYNPGEIECVAEVVSSLMGEANQSTPPLRAEEIGVMAPWREQVWKLRERLRKDGWSRVDVGSVEDFQGREKRVIIMSCVRSIPKYLSEDQKRGIGIIFERKRMNVAITRAKELLVVVGNGSLLSRDPYWKGFLQFAMRNELYVGPDLNIEMDGAWLSRLESQIIQAQEENGFAGHDSADRSAMMIAGGLAREVLRDI